MYGFLFHLTLLHIRFCGTQNKNDEDADEDEDDSLLVFFQI